MNLTGQFLIAMPALGGSIFTGSLVFVCEHSEDGALGVIVNRPLGISLKDLFEKISLPEPIASLATQQVLFGGPVRHEQGFVLHRPLGHWQATIKINEEIGLTSSSDVLSSFGDWSDFSSVKQEITKTNETQSTSEVEKLLQSNESLRELNNALPLESKQISSFDNEMLLLLGYMGWGKGQLEEELADNFWLTVSGDPSILFKTEAKYRYDNALSSLGINRNQITATFGHA